MSIKFSIQIENQFGYDWDQIKNIVLKTEKYDYHSFYICDHFFLDAQTENRNALEAWTVLTAAAMITKKIRLGTLVSGNNYRHPTMLAKIAASLDMISSGRMEFGIGTGWKKDEYNAYGYEFPSVKDRLEMLEESLKIILALWTENVVNFDGKHYQIKDAVFAPKPVQKLPMIMIGGGGERKTLKFVAKYGDYMNLPFTPINQIQQKLDALEKHCGNVGRDYDEVGKSLFTQVFVSEDDEELKQYIIKKSNQYNISVDEYKNRIYDPKYPGSWVGTPEQIKDRIDYLNGLGFDYFFIQQPFDLNSDLIGKFSTLVKDRYFK